MGGTCPAINPLSFSEQWCQTVVDWTNDVNNFVLMDWLGNILKCVQTYVDYPDTDPFGPDAATSSTIKYCYPMVGAQSWGWGGFSLNLKGWLNKRCGGPGIAAMQCSCNMYSNAEFDYNHLWFAFVSLSNEARIYNFFVIVQLMISALTNQYGYLWFIGVGWYSFWVLFPVPDWCVLPREG